MVHSRKNLLLALAFTSLSACGSDDAADPGGSVEEVTASAVANYAAIVHASYEDSLEAAGDLDEAVAALIADPSEDTLDAARKAWLASREPYLQTEVYRFYQGPIDNDEDGPEGMINAWPLDENYIDYVEDDASAGIVNDVDQEIDAAALEALNVQGGEANVATGYHAIEFLLWGQDRSDTGPGERPYTDYVTGEDGTAANQDRRAEYLSTVSTLLVDHLTTVTAAWAEDDPENYRADFESIPGDEALTRILTGMIILSGFETGGERLQTALDSYSQEDEHSCFSDNTHRDMIQDIQGVKNVWTGTYTRLDGTVVAGPGIRDVVAAKDEALASELDARIDESLELANALVPPFDQEIAAENEDGRARVQALITSLRTQEGLLEDVFRDLELTVPESP